MRYFYIAIILFLCSFSARSQIGEEIHWGAKSSHESHENEVETDPLSHDLDWHLDGFLQIVSGHIAIGIEAIYDRGRYIMRDLELDAISHHYLCDTSIDHNSMIHAHKFQLPVYVLYQLRVFELMLGGAYEFKLQSDHHQKIMDTKNAFIEHCNPSFITGIWCDISKRLKIGAKYQVGIQNLNITNWNAPWRTREIQLHLGVRL